jgi:hypothetical protein
LSLQQIGIDNNAALWDIWKDAAVKSDGGILKCELEADDVMFVRYGLDGQSKNAR